MSTSSTDAKDELDRVILDSTSEVCRELGITDYTPSKVVWSRLDQRFQGLPRPVGVKIDEPLVLLQDQVVIHEELRKILGKDQLKALLAYALVRQRKTGTHERMLSLIVTASLVALLFWDSFSYLSLSGSGRRLTRTLRLGIILPDRWVTCSHGV